ncbi:MAG: Lrp/AsnC family transcriptional regulator [Thermococcus sp.]|uniref:Lrp/AsnC family transcriptional regulator n=1 Tax=Thermococcus sp. TaxID=35749 RepID=UPI001DDFDA67|nr:Lrp/AsnC family transcriptional regulator [Thermococcus sp.]MBO8174155.1 Lrp/AsnC family transcriptional regulator [Thermococcus sp.]
MKNRNDKSRNRRGVIKWSKEEIEFWKQMSKGELSDIDVMIYLALRENGRIPDTELARMLGVSVPTARRHRIALQEKGYLQVMGMLIFEEFGLASADVILKFREEAEKEEIEAFIQEAIENPKVFEIDEYIGEYDIVIKFFDKDFKELKKTIENFITGRKIIQKSLILPAVSSPKLFTKPMKYKHAR